MSTREYYKRINKYKVAVGYGYRFFKNKSQAQKYIKGVLIGSKRLLRA